MVSKISFINKQIIIIYEHGYKKKKEFVLRFPILHSPEQIKLLLISTTFSSPLLLRNITSPWLMLKAVSKLFVLVALIIMIFERTS